jgi:hypothetical protein
MGGLSLTVGLVGVCDRGLLFEPPKSTSLLFNHLRSSKNPASGGKGLVGGLHYSKAKGGSHENQDEREGWHQEIELIGARGAERDYPSERKGGCHEDQDECEGWPCCPYSSVRGRGEDGSETNKLGGKESSHEKQNECEGRHPDQRLLSHIDPREHQPKDKSKRRPRKASFRVTRRKMQSAEPFQR